MKSKRLTYRDLQFTDAARITELAGDWDVARMTARIPYPYTLTQADQWISSLDDGEFVQVVELDSRLIGAVGYTSNADGSLEIGYWIGRPWWGQGYGTEAAETLMSYCFDTVGVSRLTCCHFDDNPASARIIKKLGFRAVGQCSAWCEARQAEATAMQYQRKRPLMSRLWSRAA